MKFTNLHVYKSGFWTLFEFHFNQIFNSKISNEISNQMNIKSWKIIICVEVSIKSNLHKYVGEKSSWKCTWVYLSWGEMIPKSISLVFPEFIPKIIIIFNIKISVQRKILRGFLEMCWPTCPITHECVYPKPILQVERENWKCSNEYEMNSGQ